MSCPALYSVCFKCCGKLSGKALVEHFQRAALARITTAGGMAVAGWDLDTEWISWKNMTVLRGGGVEVNLSLSEGRFSQGCSLGDFVMVFGASIVKIDVCGQSEIDGKLIWIPTAPVCLTHFVVRRLEMCFKVLFGLSVCPLVICGEFLC
jgi:hypothetical protein